MGRCLGAGGVAPGMVVSALAGRGCAGSLGESLPPFSPGLSGSAGVAAFHPTAAWMTFPGESGVAVGRTADASAVTHFTGHSPGRLVPPPAGH